MSTLGTFDAFTTARLGIYAAQLGLQVTGNNVANINTEGYTRQRLDQVSFKAGAYDRYRSQLDNHVGSGALVMSINQIRDPYLDVRYRNTNATVGYSDTMLAGLQRIADILDEIGLGEDASDNEKGDGVLHAQFQDLADRLRAFSESPTELNDTLVRNSAETLCYLLNDYADELNKFYNETVEDFNDEVDIINECLTNIRDLNREIRDCEIYGDNALELRDERNRQIDTLSEHLHIKVVYTEETIGGAQTVEKLSIYLDDDNPDPDKDTDRSMLIDGVFGAQLYRTPKPNPDFDPDQDSSETNMPYLDEEGNPVLNLKDAAPTDNFDLSITKLVDVKDNEWKGVSTVYEPVDAATQAIIDALLKETDATATGGTAPNEWSIKEPAVAAIYNFEYTPATEWAEGDKFKIGGVEYTIGENGALTLEQANDKAAMVQFIAGKLADIYNNDPDSKYTVSADPDDDTRIRFTAKEAGVVSSADKPRLNELVEDDPAGKLQYGVRQVVQAGKDAVLEPPPVQTTQDQPEEGSETVVSYSKINGVWNTVTTYIRHTKEVDLDDNDLYGRLQATRELLTEAGEFATQDTVDNIDENATEKRGIPYYIYSLDLLAKQFADQYNKINVGYMQDQNGYYINENGTQLTIANQPISSTEGLTKEQQEALNNANLTLDQWLENSSQQNGGAVKMGGVLFSNCNDNDDPSGITAANISVSHSWSNRSVQLVPTFKMLFPDGEGGKMEHSTQNDNANHMLNMIEQSLIYDPTQIVDGAVSGKLFEGNFNDMFNNMNVTLGKDIRENTITLNNSYARLVETDTQREGVSGVDLNDEALNMMQFSKAMSAAMRLMTVIDESLDRLINNTAV